MDYIMSLFKKQQEPIKYDILNCKQFVKDLFDHKIVNHIDMDNVRIFCTTEINNYIDNNQIIFDTTTPTKSNLYFDKYSHLNNPFKFYDDNYIMNKKNDYYDKLFHVEPK